MHICRSLDAFLYDARVLDYEAAQDGSDGCRLRTAGRWFAMTGYAIAFPIDSPWISPINHKLLYYRLDKHSLVSCTSTRTKYSTNILVCNEFFIKYKSNKQITHYINKQIK